MGSLRNCIFGPSRPKRTGAQHGRALHRVYQRGRWYCSPTGRLGSPANGLLHQQDSQSTLHSFECSNEVLEELNTNFRYNDAVLRSMVIRCDEAITDESPIMKAEQESRERKSRREERQPRDDNQDSDDDMGDEPEAVAESSSDEEE